MLDIAVTKLGMDIRIQPKIPFLIAFPLASYYREGKGLRLEIKQAGTLCTCWRPAPIQLLSLQPPDRHQQSCNSVFKLWGQRGAEVTKPCQIT